MDWENVLAYVIETVLGIVVSVAIPYLVSIFKKKVDNQIANDLISKASTAVTECVRYVNQTYVNGLKAEGKFDKDAQQIAFAKCVEAIESILSDSTKEAITTVCGDITMWITTMVESDVLFQKELSSNLVKND